MKPLARLALVYDVRPTRVEGGLPDLYAEFESMEHIQDLHAVLESLGFSVVLVDAHADVVSELLSRREAIDLVFNYSVGFFGRSRETRIPALCELLKLACLGSDPMAHAIGANKHLVKCLAANLGIHTPPWFVATSGESLPLDLEPTLIVKPVYEGSSMGITGPVPATDAERLRAEITRVSEAYGGSVLVEAFVPGHDVTVPLVGDPLRVLPPVLLTMGGEPREATATFTTELKLTGRAGWIAMPAVVADASRIEAQALSIARAMGCRDFARIDFRVTPEGGVYLLEVNTTPHLDPVGGAFAVSAEAAGHTFESTIMEMIASALRRSDHSQNQSSAI